MNNIQHVILTFIVAHVFKNIYKIIINKNHGTAIKNKNYARLYPAFISLSIVATIFVSFSLIFQQSYAEDYKLNIAIKNEDEVNTKADLSIKTDDDKEETTVRLTEDSEQI